MSDRNEGNNVVWRDPDGHRPTIIREDRRADDPVRGRRRTHGLPRDREDGPPGAVPRRLRIHKASTRRAPSSEELVLEDALELVWRQLDAGELEAAVGLARANALEERLEELRGFVHGGVLSTLGDHEAVTHRHHEQIGGLLERAERLDKARAEELADGEERDQEVRELRDRVAALEEGGGRPILKMLGDLAEGVGGVEGGLEAYGRELQELRGIIPRVENLERHAAEIDALGIPSKRWAGAGFGPVGETEEIPVSARAEAHEREPARPDHDRRVTDRRTEPYTCTACGAPLDKTGGALGVTIYACSDLEHCGAMDPRRAPGNDRRNAQLATCWADGCDRKTGNPLWLGWRWARTDAEDAGAGGWLCPDHSLETIPEEIQRCARCAEWADATALYAGIDAAGMPARVCVSCHEGAEPSDDELEALERARDAQADLRRHLDRAAQLGRT